MWDFLSIPVIGQGVNLSSVMLMIFLTCIFLPQEKNGCQQFFTEVRSENPPSLRNMFEIFRPPGKMESMQNT